MQRVMEIASSCVLSFPSTQDQILLKTEIRFPNLTFNTTNVDFGCILNDVEVMKVAYMTNPGPLPVKYAWYFISRPPVMRGKDLSDEGVDMESDYDSPEEEIPLGGKWEDREGDVQREEGQKDERMESDERQLVMQDVEEEEIARLKVNLQPGGELQSSGFGEGTSTFSRTNPATTTTGSVDMGTSSVPPSVAAPDSKINSNETNLQKENEKTLTQHAFVSAQEASGSSAQTTHDSTSQSRDCIPQTLSSSSTTSTSSVGSVKEVKKKNKKKKKKNIYREAWRNARDPFQPIPINQVSGLSILLQQFSCIANSLNSVPEPYYSQPSCT